MKKFTFILIFFAFIAFKLQEPETSLKEAVPSAIVSVPSCQGAMGDEARDSIQREPTQTETLPQPLWTDDETEFRKQFSIQSHHQITPEEFPSPLGTTRVYHFSQGGVPILGMVVRLAKDLRGRVVEQENTYRPIPEVPIDVPEIEKQAADLKERSLNDGRYQISQVDLASTVILVRKNVSEGQIAFSLSAKDTFQKSEPIQLLVRSTDGKVLQKTFGRKDFHF